MIVVMFFGGMILNAMNPAYIIMDCPLLMCCALPQFFNFGFLTYSLTNPVQEYMKFRFTEDITGVSVCEPQLWVGKHGVYFKDGWLYQPKARRLNDGSLSVDPNISSERRLLAKRTAYVKIDHCRWQSGDKNSPGRWLSCEVGVRPIFRENMTNPGDEPPCAWAIQEGTEPTAPDCGMLDAGGLCGVSTDFEKFAKSCGSQGCERGRKELWAGIQAAAEGQSVNYVGPGPLVVLGSPLAMESELSAWLWYATLSAIVYVPLPLCFLCCTVAATKGSGGSFRGLKLRGIKIRDQQSRESTEFLGVEGEEESQEEDEDDEDDLQTPSRGCC